MRYATATAFRMALEEHISRLHKAGSAAIHALTFPWKDRENTRVKDLVDIVLILETKPPDPEPAHLALEAVFRHRDTHPLPARIADPPLSWTRSYSASATEIGLSHIRMEDAMELLRAYWTKVFP